MFINNDYLYMQKALELASLAQENGDVPVGAVIADKDGIIGSGFNTRERDRDPLGHAEINAIKTACYNKNSKRLCGSTLYVTLEPCPMCTGAILESFLDRVIYGCKDPKMGACGSVINLSDYPGLCRRIKVYSGLLDRECSLILENFFRKLRRRDG